MFKLPLTFYHPEDGSGAASISYKFRGEDEELDLSDPEQYQRAKALLEKGRLYDEKMHEMAEIKRKAENYDTWADFLDGVRNGEISTEELIKTFDNYGIKLTSAEKKALQDDIDYGTDEARPEIVNKLESKLNTVEKKLQELELEKLSVQIQNAHKVLSQKYDGRDGMPKYDSEEVAKYAAENGIYSPDPVKQYELAYYDLYRDQILEAQRKSVTESKLKQQQKREKAFVESGETAFKFDGNKKNPKDMDINDIINSVDDEKLFVPD